MPQGVHLTAHFIKPNENNKVQGSSARVIKCKAIGRAQENIKTLETIERSCKGKMKIKGTEV